VGGHGNRHMVAYGQAEGLELRMGGLTGSPKGWGRTPVLLASSSWLGLMESRGVPV
jgi:hypothetical protein